MRGRERVRDKRRSGMCKGRARRRDGVKARGRKRERERARYRDGVKARERERELDIEMK